MRSDLQPRVELVLYPAGWSQSPHVDGIDALSLILAGRIRELSGHHTALAGPGQVVVKPSAAVHETLFVEDTVVLRLEHARLFDPHADMPWHWSTSRRLATGFLAALVALRDGRVAAALDVVRDLALTVTASSDPVPGRPPEWLLRAHDELADRAHEGVTVAEVAELAGVHPVYLARAYRRYFAMTPSEALQRFRLGRAMRAAVFDGQSLSRAAAVGGLSDQSHFNRSCGALLGTTPARALAHIGIPVTKVSSIQVPRMRLVYPPAVAVHS